MADNQSIHGIRDDEPARRGKKRRGRKQFVLQTRWVRGLSQRGDIGWLFRSLEKWHIHSRYHTESARDMAYTALVKKAAVCSWRVWTNMEYRKV